MAKGYFIEGVKRSGKTKYAVDMIDDYLRRGRKVATNLDLYLDKMDIKNPHVVRLPDHPRSSDLLSLGCGYPELDESDSNYDESKNGLVVIDELLTHLNSRNFKDKDRLAIVSWFVQMGKYGWDLVLIGQDFDSVDKQLRDTTIDQLVSVKSGANYFGFGFFNSIVHVIFNAFNVPKFSIARFYDGKSKTRKAQGYQFYIKSHVHKYYNTAQKFLPDTFLSNSGTLIDMRASYCMIPTEQLKSWYLVKDAVKKRVEEIKEKSDSDTKPKNKIKNVLFSKKSLFMIIIALLVFYYAFTSFTNTKSSTNTVTNHPAKTLSTNVHPYNSELIPDIFKGVYITCLVISTDKNFNYCFEKDGIPFYPNSLGYSVNLKTECSATVSYEDTKFNVFCSPTRIESYSAAKPLDDDDNSVSLDSSV